MTPASWIVLLQEEPDKKMMFAKYQRTSSILQLQKKIKVKKNSVNPGWVEPDLNYILLLVINWIFYRYKIFNINQS